MGDSEIGQGAASVGLSIPAKGLMPFADSPSRPLIEEAEATLDGGAEAGTEPRAERHEA
jgi:hypothetical protein